MRTRAALVAAAAALGLVAAASVPAVAAPGGRPGPPGSGISSITAITEVYNFGQKVAAVAVEYPEVVNPRILGAETYSVSDSIYNFRFNDLADLDVTEDRTITRVYTNDEPALDPSGTSERGRYVIIELDPTDRGGNTVMRSTCQGFLCYEAIRQDIPTTVTQHQDVFAQPGNGQGRGRLLAASSSESHPLSRDTINVLVDDFVYETGEQGGRPMPYAYHLPTDYDPSRTYPMVVVLAGWGGGYNGINEGVQVAVDIMATAWLQEEWTGSDEDVIVLAPQSLRTNTPEASAAMVNLVRDFSQRFAVDTDRIYLSGFSMGTQLSYDAMSNHPGLFAGTLINAGFTVTAAQAARIAEARTPIWIAHGTSDPVLPVTNGRTSADRLRAAYVAAGVDPARAQQLVRFSEFGNDAFAQPDYHAVTGPVYETQPILDWLLSQSR